MFLSSTDAGNPRKSGLKPLAEFSDEELKTDVEKTLGELLPGFFGIVGPAVYDDFRNMREEEKDLILKDAIPMIRKMDELSLAHSDESSSLSVFWALCYMVCKTHINFSLDPEWQTIMNKIIGLLGQISREDKEHRGYA